MFNAMQVAGAIGKKDPIEVYRDSCFSVLNPTFGTGIAFTDAATAYDVTTPSIHIYNSDTTNLVRWISLQKLFLRATSVNTGATSLHMQFTKRTGDTYTSGGSVLSTTPGIFNIGASAYANATASQRASVATIRAGILVASAAASTTDKVVWRQQIRDVILAADDTFDIDFGGGQTGTHGATTSATQKTVSFPPMWVGPGESLQIHWFGPSQSADADFELSMFWIEGPQSA